MKDITERASNLRRGSCILYKNKHRTGEDPADYLGVLRTLEGNLHWVCAWGRTVNGAVVIELALTPKHEPVMGSPRE
jgi:hypothetical protein